MEQVPPNSEKMAKFTGSVNTLEKAGGNYHFLRDIIIFRGRYIDISSLGVRLSSFISD